VERLARVLALLLRLDLADVQDLCGLRHGLPPE
jgi:hypothetical protein